jgi:hypothetical protein
MVRTWENVLDQSGKINMGKPETLITDYITHSAGLEMRNGNQDGELVIFQKADGKSMRFNFQTVDEVLERTDSEGRGFLQVNFLDGRKILLTEKLVGFKPAETKGLDLKKLPKVVTTPDLISVVEAIEETLNGSSARNEEIEVLRRVFDSVLMGARAVGFDLDAEKAWVNCISTVRSKTAA